MTKFEQILLCLLIHTHTQQIQIINTSVVKFNCTNNIATCSMYSTMNLNSPWSLQAQCRLKLNFNQALQYVSWNFKAILHSGFLGLPNTMPLLCWHWCLCNCWSFSCFIWSKAKTAKGIGGDRGGEIKLNSFRPVIITSYKCWEPVSLKIRPEQRKNGWRAGFIWKSH